MRRRDLLMLPLAAVAGCAPSPPPPPPPPVLHLSIRGGADQNPDPSGGAAPVVIRIFQLAQPDRFQRADVFALMQQPQATLGPDMLGMEEVVVRPGQELTLTRDLKPNTRFIGLAALFRDIDHAQWRVLTPAAASGPTAVVLTLTGNAASLQAGT